MPSSLPEENSQHGKEVVLKPESGLTDRIVIGNGLGRSRIRDFNNGHSPRARRICYRTDHDGDTLLRERGPIGAMRLHHFSFRGRQVLGKGGPWWSQLEQVVVH
jgi:hypothetical protein